MTKELPEEVSLTQINDLIEIKDLLSGMPIDDEQAMARLNEMIQSLSSVINSLVGDVSFAEVQQHMDS